MDHDGLINKRIKRLARDYRLSVARCTRRSTDIRSKVDRDLYLKRTLALEVLRLDELEMAFPGQGH